MQTDIPCDLPLMLKLCTFCWGGMLTFEMCGTRKFLHQDNFTEIEINHFWWRQRVKNRFEQFDRFRPWLRGRHSLLIRCRYGCATENVWGQPSNWESMGQRGHCDGDEEHQIAFIVGLHIWGKWSLSRPRDMGALKHVLGRSPQICTVFCVWHWKSKILILALKQIHR